MENKLKFAVAPDAHQPDVTVMTIAGFIDAARAPEFEAALQKLLAAGHTALILDFQSVSYISSAGIGVIVGFLKAFRERSNGDIKLMRVPAKISRILGTIGLAEMIDVLPAAIDHWVPRPLEAPVHHLALAVLDPAPVCGEPFRVRIEARDAFGKLASDYASDLLLDVNGGSVFPKKISGLKNGFWEGHVTATEEGDIVLTARDETISGEIMLHIGTPETLASFPRTLACARCGRMALVKGSDIYRCPGCNEIFYVDMWAHVISLHRHEAAPAVATRHKGVEIKLSGDVNYLAALRALLNDIGRQEGLPEDLLNDAVLAVEEAALNIIEHSYHFEPSHPLAVQVRFQRNRLVIKIRDHGEPHDPTVGGTPSLKACILRGRKSVGSLLIHQLMDQVNYRSYKKFNQLTMSKRLPRSRRKRT